MQPKIKIGLTYTGTDEKHNYYVNWLKGNDDIEIIGLSEKDHNLEKIKELDAVVLSGGVDAHPKNYGSDIIDYPNAPLSFNEKRDLFETEVFELSQRQQLPALFICRGMQLVNCILGGDMVQDIGPGANDIHRNEGVDKKHDISILPGTLLSSIAATEKDSVNTAHHQSINTIGNGLQVNAFSEDGIIEGVEWADKTNKPFFLGVQWHPERMFKLGMQASPLSKNIREYFINEIKKSKGEK
jgi:putative glutamine amidotransferase